jgi:hypothetical protein
MFSTIFSLVLPTILLISPITAAPALQSRQTINGENGVAVHNNYGCKSAHNPIVMLHGLGATYYEDLNYLEQYLQGLGFCTFSLTYGAYTLFPYVGGLKSIATSAPEIATFIQTVQTKTGASKLNIIGHSEGAFQSLYVPKFQAGISGIIDKIIAIAPPTHGTSFGGLDNLAYVGGSLTEALVTLILDAVGCDACNDLLPGGAAVLKLNDGRPIAQQGNNVTMIISTKDELVTPTSTAFINEAGVQNVYVQQPYYPNDVSGHIGEAYDINIWTMIVEVLTNAPFASGTGNGGGTTI